MSNTTIQLRKSGETGNTPSDLNYGELALNYADGKLYYKNAIGIIDHISTGGNSFGTVNANSSLITASSTNDTFSIVPGDNVIIVGDGISKNLTISLVDSPSFNSLSINTHATVFSTSYTTSNTSQATIDSFDIGLYRSAKYDAQMTSGTDYHAMELRVLHDNSLVFMLQYGEIVTASLLGLFDAEIVGGSLNILFTPTNNITTIKLVRTAIIT